MTRKILFYLVFLSFALSSFASVNVTEKSGSDGKGLIVIDNAVMTVTVNPSEGGRVSGFIWKATGKEWVLPGEDGFFLDHVWQQSWPGELLHRPYTAKILDNGPARGVVEVSVTIQGNGDKSIEGVRLVRTMTVTGDRPGIDVTIRLENPTTEPRSPGLWVQNVPQLGGVRNNLWTFRPTTRGIISASADYSSGQCVIQPSGYKPESDFLSDPVAGWTAETYPPTGEGVVFLMDYNYLRCLYDCGGSTTVEWWYDQVRLAPGKSFVTGFVMWPVSGMAAVGYANRALVGDLQMNVKEPNLNLVNRMVIGPDAVTGPARVNLELIDYDTGKVLQSKDFPGVEVTAVPSEQVFAIPNAPLAKNLLARATVTTADGRPHVYETYRAHGAVIGTETLYKTNRPARERTVERPDVISLTKHEGFRILHLRGPFHNYYQLPEAAKTIGAELKYGSYGTFVYGPSLSYFPSDYPELMGYDVIVIDNVPTDAMDEQTQQYLADYVENGGVLLVIGGHWAFGGGGYRGSKLESVLPVTSLGPFDVIKIKNGYLSPAPVDSTKTGTLWLQNVLVRSEAQVLMKAGDRPFWIQWHRGKGMAIVMAGLCYGESTKGMTLFCDWSGWSGWLATQLKQAVSETREGGNNR